MTDISKCDGKGCSIRSNCHRFTAPSNIYYQSYIVQEKDKTDGSKGNQCIMYWPNKVPKDSKNNG